MARWSITDTPGTVTLGIGDWQKYIAVLKHQIISNPTSDYSSSTTEASWLALATAAVEGVRPANNKTALS